MIFEIILVMINIALIVYILIEDLSIRRLRRNVSEGLRRLEKSQAISDKLYDEYREVYKTVQNVMNTNETLLERQRNLLHAQEVIHTVNKYEPENESELSE